MLAIAGQDDSTLVGEALTNTLVAHGQGGCTDWRKEGVSEERYEREWWWWWWGDSGREYYSLLLERKLTMVSISQLR